MHPPAWHAASWKRRNYWMGNDKRLLGLEKIIYRSSSIASECFKIKAEWPKDFKWKERKMVDG